MASSKAKSKTELQQAVAKLTESEKRYRNLWETAMVGLYRTRIEDGQMIEANQAVVDLLGYETKRELLAEFKTSEHYADPERRGELLRQLKEHGKVDLFEITATRRDGSHVPIGVSATIYPERGVIEGVVIDLTERKRAEEERSRLEAHLQQSRKLESLGVLAGGIAHDFNNLLVPILGNADLALVETPPDSPLRDYLVDIETAANRASSLCKQMLVYAGKESFEMKPLCISDVLLDMTHILDVSTPKEITIELDFPSDLPAIEAEAAQLSQIVMNLVTNASEAIEGRAGPGTITIKTGVEECSRSFLDGTVLGGGLPSGRYVFLEVTDNGKGMRPETQEKIFQPFFTTKFAGRGLGLAATLGIIRGHNSTVQVVSQPGKGSTFRIFFPVTARSPEALPAEASASAAWCGSGTILLVDDEDKVRKVAERMLSRMGFDVLTATSGRQAVEIVKRCWQKQNKITCVLMDLTMPEMDGEAAFQEIRKIDPHLRVVFSSGYGEKEVMSRFTDRGSIGFIQKPYRADKLREVLKEALAETPD